ncbi:MAG: succinate dehydrogenase cytochrome b subunit [Actinomycetota bacterium]|nr:succinate dehydrogenase cytochrome b subunit [Actinomycetota bacterium]
MATTTPARSAPVFRRPARRLPFPLGLYQTYVGKKWVMGVTGIALLGYVVVHMIGNLHLYEGPAQVNHYGEALRDLGGELVPRTLLLWLLRIGLTTAFVLHIHAAISLTATNRKANGTRYQSKRDYIAADFASRSMRVTGIIIFLYVIFHLADLTWGWLLGDEYIRGDVYHNVVESLSSLPIAIIYIVANIAVAVHIYHGAWSMFQTLGINNPRFNVARRYLATGLAAMILLGNLSFPIMVQAGLISEDDRTTPYADEEHGEEGESGEAAPAATTTEEGALG